MAKKKDVNVDVTLNEKSLKNLEKRKKITKENAKEMQLKGAAKKVENNIKKRVYKEEAQKTLDKLLNSIGLDSLTKDFENLSTKDKLAVLEHLANYSGQKPADKRELTGAGGEALVQKVFILPDELKAIDDHIDGVINDGQSG